MSEHYDLVVVGGGINGVGIAADAAGRGLKVALFEASDLASATSSNSSKLIHGGLRYLEHYEFRLVKEALAEREVLLGMAPHIARPMRFRLPHRPHLRPAWMIRAGLFLYDNLAKRDKLKGSCGVRFLPQDGLTAGISKGFEYSDAWVDDARLVVLNAMMARDKGADVQTRTRCVKAVRGSKHWTLTLELSFYAIMLALHITGILKRHLWVAWCWPLLVLAAWVSIATTDQTGRRQPIRILRETVQMLRTPMWSGFYSAMRPFKKTGFHPDQIDTTELVAYWQRELFGTDGQLADHVR